jgi:uracil-DNA glycosylase
MQDKLTQLKEFLNFGVTEIVTNEARNYLEPKAKIEEITKCPKVNHPPKIQFKLPESEMKNIQEAANNAMMPPNEAISMARELADKSNSLTELKENLGNFNGCSLKNTAKQMVFSDGTPQSKIMLIGEAPGANEDEQGIPFCGQSGKLLDDIFKAISLFREKNLYISNSVFWRPPGNRRPTDSEIAICRPFVEKHIALLKPKIIILIGSTATASLLPDITETISKVRGRFMKYNNQYLTDEITISAIFHPSYLLRQPQKKSLMWQDILKINKFLTENND